MEQAIHAANGFVGAAPVESGGSDQVDVGQIDSEQLAEVSEAMEGMFRRLWSRLFPPRPKAERASAPASGMVEQASEVPPPRREGEAPPPLPEPPADQDAPAREPAARPLRVAVAKAPKVDVGRIAVGYARMPRGTPYPGLSDELRRRVDALPAHERESLAGTGSHYDGLRALEEIEARVKRAAAYDRVHGYNSGNTAIGPRFTPGIRR